jgi:hypothetical protein
MRPYFEKVHHKKGVGGLAQGVGPKFNPQNRKKKKEIVLHNTLTKISERLLEESFNVQ